MLCRKLMSIVLAGAMTTTMCAPAYAATGTTEAVRGIFSDVRRRCRIYKHEEIIGKDRYETGAMVAERVGKYSRVILVNGSESMADGLSAASIAGRLGATILPIKSNVIPSSSKEIINKAKEVYIIGGTKAISRGIENSIRSAGKKVFRLGGRDRCETSLKVAKFLGPYSKAYLVNGYEGEADAMSISPISARDGAPVIITNGKTSNLPYNPKTKYVVIGGTSVMSQKLTKKYNGHRIGGANRYDTNRMVINTYSAAGKTRYFCNGETLVDALSASFMAMGDGIVLVNRKENHDLLKWIDTVQVGGPKFDIYFPDLHMWDGVLGDKPEKPSGITTEVTNIRNDKGEYYVKFLYKGGESWEWKGRTEGDMYKPGHHIVKVRDVDENGNKSDWVDVEFDVIGHGPADVPVIDAVVRRNPNPGRDFPVDLSISNKGDYEVEWDGVSKDGYYSPGKHVVKARFVDKFGYKSDWSDKEFEVTDNAPTKPVVEVIKSRDTNGVKVDFNIITPSIDVDGDSIEYQWQGKSSDGYYPVGQHVVHVRATDSTGKSSEWVDVPFIIEDETKPVFPDVRVEIDRTPTEDRKFKVDFVVDKPGYTVTVNGGTPDSLYPAGEHTVKVKVTDANGNESEWMDKTFEITDGKPTNPEFKVEQTKNDKGAMVKFVEVKASIDPDGDKVEYVWGGDYKGDGQYPPGKYEATVQAVDSTGLKSDVIKLPFEISDGKIPSDKLPDIKTTVAEDPNPDGKYKVDITVDGNYEIEIKGGNPDGLYFPGDYQVEVQLTDNDGNKSDWIPVEFEVIGKEPKPEFKPVVNVEVGKVADENGKYQVDITSPDGEVEIKNGNPDGKYEQGHYEVDVTVTNKDGDTADVTVEFDVPTKVVPNPDFKPVINTEVGNEADENGKYQVDITSPDGDVEIKGGEPDGKYPPGHYEVEVQVTKPDGEKSEWIPVEFDVPKKPIEGEITAEIKVDISEKPVQGNKHEVTITSPQGTVEVKDGKSKDLYDPGHYTVKVQVTTPEGKKSAWIDTTFDVPLTPDLDVKISDTADPDGKREVTITDKNGNNVEIKDPKPGNKYEPGKHVIQVQVSDDKDNKSEWVDVTVTIPLNVKINVEIGTKPNEKDERKVDITSPQGNVEVRPADEDGYYPPGHHDVEVQVTDEKGNKSEWIPVGFDVPITADLDVKVDPNPNPDGKHKVTITDKHGYDVIVKDGKAEDYYSPGKHELDVQVADKKGNKSEWVKVEFTIKLKADLSVVVGSEYDEDGKRKVTITDKHGHEVIVIDGAPDSMYPPGTHDLQVKVKDKAGNESDIVDVQVTIPKKPVIPSIVTTIDKVPREDGKHKVVITDKNGNTVEVKNGKAEDWYLPGHHQVEVQVTDKFGSKSEWFPVEFDIAKYVPTDVVVKVTRNPNPEREFPVEFTTPLEDASVEVVEGSETGYYPAGDNSVKLQIIDKDGNKSDVFDAKFNIPDTKPTTPDFDVNMTNGEEGTRVKLPITVPSTDADGDEVSYVWTKDEESFNPNPGGDIFTPGSHTITLKAVDSTGRESDVVTKTFEVGTPPGMPNVIVNKTREVKGIGPLRKFKVLLDVGDQDVEWRGKDSEDYYTPNKEQTVEVRTKGADGLYSPWKEIKFTVTDTAPTKPEIEAVRVSEDSFDAKINFVKGSTDADGDAIEYQWKGKLEDGKYGPGPHKVEVKAVDSTGQESDWAVVTFEFKDNRPSNPKVVTDAADRVAQDGKVKVTVTPSGSVSPLGRDITYEYEGKQPGDLYELGKEYTVKVRAKDTNGLVSDWVSETFTVNNTAPSKPSFVEKITGEWEGDKQKVTLDVTESIDAEGDKITYEWEEDGSLTDKISDFFEVGTHTIRVRAKDAFGAVSDWFEKTFTINAPKPTDPIVTASEERIAQGGKAKVVVTAKGSTTPNNAPVEYVFDSGKAIDDLYDLNKSYTVKAKAVAGKYESNWVPVTFEVKNSAPEKPDFTINQEDQKWYEGKQKVECNPNPGNAETDADGDKIEYVWGGDYHEDGLYTPGEYNITYTAVDIFGVKSEVTTKSFTVGVPNPTKPKVDVSKDRKGSGGKAEVILTPSGSVSPEGKEVTYEWDNGKAEDNLYTLNEEHVAKVRAKAGDLYSEWTEVRFTVNNGKPSQPSFTINQEDQKWYDEKQKVVLTPKESIDPDGDKLEYVWGGDYHKDGLYAPGEYTVTYKAVDVFGVESEPYTGTFEIGTPKPTVPTITLNDKDRIARNGKVEVTVKGSGSVSPIGSEIHYVIEGEEPDKLYNLNQEYTVRVKAVDAKGNESPYAEKTFTVVNTAPSKPSFSFDKIAEWLSGEQKVDIELLEGKDAEGDAVTYEWEEDGRLTDKISDFFTVGTHTIKVRAKDAFGAVSDWFERTFTIDAPKPTNPVITVSQERVAQDGKAKVMVTVDGSTTPDNAEVRYEVTGVTRDNLYDLNTPITITAKAVAGKYESEEVTKTFEVKNTAPEKPEFTVDQKDQKWYEGKQKVMLNPNPGNPKTDADGDALEYVWVGKHEDNLYEPGKYTVKYKAVDIFGVESPEASATFTVAEPKPTTPKIHVDKSSRLGSGGKGTAIVTASGSTSPDGKEVKYVWEGKAGDDLYTLNKPITVKVKAVCGKYESDWATETFTIENKAPNKPSFTVNTEDKAWYDNKMKATVELVEGVDPDGDTVTHEWEGKDSNDLYLPGQEVTLRVRAVDSFGVGSDWVEQKFTLEYPNPTEPTLNIDTSKRQGKEGKALVPVSASGSKAFGDATIVDYEFKGKAGDNYYTLNETHKILVRAKDSRGNYSEWVEGDLLVSNGVTPNPVFDLIDSDRNWYDGKQKITINVTSPDVDNDGDKLTFEFDTLLDDLYSPGVHTVRVRAKDVFGVFSDWVEKTFTINEPVPTKPTITLSKERKGKDGKAEVMVKVDGSTSPAGREIHYEFDPLNNKALDNLYPLNKPYTVRARAVDSEGIKSDWAEATINVSNSAPSKPTLEIAKGGWKKGKQVVNITANEDSVDPDGDAITYELKGNAPDNLYSPGAHNIQYRAVDVFGVASAWNERSFEVENKQSILITGNAFNESVGGLIELSSYIKPIDTVRFETNPEIDLDALMASKVELTEENLQKLEEGTLSSLPSYIKVGSDVPESIIAHAEGNELVVTSNFPIYANPNSAEMFSGYSNIVLDDAALTLDLEQLHLSKVVNAQGMFGTVGVPMSLAPSPGLHIIKSNWDTNNIKNMSFMFADGSLASVDLSTFDTESATTMEGMFRLVGNNLNQPTLKLDLTNFNTVNVTNMSYMFENSSIEVPIKLSNFNTANVTNMSDMFASSSFIDIDLTGFTPTSLTNINNMFSRSAATTIKVPNLVIADNGVSRLYHVFADCDNLTSIDLSSWDTSKITDISGLFSGATSLSAVNLNGWDVGKVRDASFSFDGCSSLASLDVSTWDTSSLEDMTYMFSGCSQISSLDFHNWNTSKVTNMSRLFQGCTSLPMLDLTSFDTRQVSKGYNRRGLFTDCTSLEYVCVGPNWDITGDDADIAQEKLDPE